MTAAMVTEARLRPQVRRVLRAARSGGVRVMAFRCLSGWDGPERVQVDDKTVRVVFCPTALAVREALIAKDADDTPLVVLTPRTESELGLDVLARLEKPRLLPIETWEAAKDLFQAMHVDPAVSRHRWLADWLMETAPAAGYPPVPSGVLDADTAWGALFQHRFGLNTAGLDLERLVQWTRSGSSKSFGTIDAEPRAAAVAWVEQKVGKGAIAILRLVTSGRGADALALGLVVRVLAGDNGPDGLRARDALVRMEPWLGGLSLSDAQRNAWADAAERLLSSLPPDDGARTQARALELLRELRAEELAHGSPYLSRGLEQRLQELARTLDAIVSQPAAARLPAMDRAAAAVLAHESLTRDERRQRLVSMACRLARRLCVASGAPPPGTFGEAVRLFVSDGSWADRAREAFWHGDSVPELNDVIRTLAARTSTAREADNQRFATLLAGWMSDGHGTTDVLTIESVLERVVAPLGEKVPALLVVIDGLSLPVHIDLLADLQREGWVERAPADARGPVVAIAAAPSVTEVSRASLLCGEIVRGNAATEKAGFARHRRLCEVSAAALPPVLFHKADLVGDGGVGLDGDVRAAIEETDRRIVGVVVNAVDDHLCKGDQVSVRWGLDSIGPLRKLMEAAAASGRVVVITSDHGHVLDRDMEYRRHELASSRWRPSVGAPDREEVRLEGRRVVSPDGRGVLVPWSERFRYASKQNGYHGGATAQEMVVPVSVMTPPAVEVPGWREVAARVPPWWDERAVTDSVVTIALAQASDRAPDVTVASPPKKGQSLDLFASRPATAPSTVTTVPLVAKLMSSKLYGEQRTRHSRLALPDERMSDLLTALLARGGKLTTLALSRSLNIPPLRLTGVLTAARRVLNVDGYGVLTVDDESGTVELNVPLLETQFGCKE